MDTGILFEFTELAKNLNFTETARLLNMSQPTSVSYTHLDVYKRQVDEQTVIAQAEKAIGYLNADDFEGLESMSVEAMADPSAKTSIEEAQALISSDWGEFKSFGNAYAAEVVQAGQVVEVVEIGAVYENVSVTYTIMFNEDMVLTGLSMK